MITTSQIERKLANYFGFVKCIIVPNVSWGLKIHECDLLIITKAGYVTEIEIKISKADIKKDLKKWHKHQSDRIRQTYFAIPRSLKSCMDLIPKEFGVILVSEGRFLEFARHAPTRKSVKLTKEEMLHVAHLGCMRIWDLKSKISGDFFKARNRKIRAENKKLIKDDKRMTERINEFYAENAELKRRLERKK